MAGSGDDLTEEQAARLVLRTAFALVAFLLAAAIAVVAQRADRDEAAEDVPVIASDADPGTGFAGGVEAVGPLQGIELDRYSEERRRVLERATGRRAAVVSFRRYVTRAEAERILRGVEIRALLVAAPGGLPSAVTGDLGEWARRQRITAREERQELERLLPTVEDDEFAIQYRADVDRLRRLEQSVSSAGAVVFGAVVVADAEHLRDLAAVERVRLVDPAPGDDAPRGDDVRGIRPEETDEAGTPPARPVRGG